MDTVHSHYQNINPQPGKEPEKTPPVPEIKPVPEKTEPSPVIPEIVPLPKPGEETSTRPEIVPPVDTREKPPGEIH